MRYHLSLLLLLRIISLCSVAVSSLPGTFLLTSNTTTNLRNSAITCTGFKMFHHRPLFRDCTRAIDLLPSSPLLAEFHATGRKDDWLLPVTKTIGTCDVSVRITPFAVLELSSWDDLRTAATKLNEACRAEKALGEITGGAIGVGDHDWIRVCIGRKGEELGGQE